MPRGRPRKTAVEPELLPPEDNQPLNQVREVKHKTEWVELRPVEEAPEDMEAEIEDAEIEDRPRKRNKNAIQEMRKKLRAQGVTPTSNLRLYIERYVHSETDAGGSWAETEFCTKYSTTEEHIFNKDYIDAARKWGPGKYRITIRMDNRIVDAFDERISATPAGPVIQHLNPNDPTSPQVIYQSTGDGQQVQQIPTLKDFMKAQREALKEQLEMAKLMREAYGFTPEQSANQPQSEEEIIAGAIIKQPAVIESVVESIIKRVGSKGGGDSDEPWWAGMLKDSITTGQLAPTVQGLVRALFPNGLFGGLFSGGQNNGQAPMAQTPLQNQPGSSVDGVSRTQGFPQGQESLPPSADRSLRSANMAGTQEHQNSPAQQATISPEQHALSRLIENCQRRVPVQVAYQQLISYADAVEEQAPDYSIYGYVDLLGSMETDQVIDFVKALPGGERVASLEWAKEWTSELQRLIKESQEGEGDE